MFIDANQTFFMRYCYACLLIYFFGPLLTAQSGFFERGTVHLDGQVVEAEILRNHEQELGRLLVMRMPGSKKRDTVAISRVSAYSLPNSNLNYRRLRVTIQKNEQELLTDRFGLEVYNGSTALYEVQLDRFEKKRPGVNLESLTYVMIHEREPVELRNLYRLQTGSEEKVLNKKLYIGILNLKLRDCAYLVSRFEETSYTESDLVALLQAYDRCKGKRVGQARSKVGGIANSKPRLDFVLGTHQPLSSSFTSSFGAIVGGNFSANFSRTNNRVRLRFQPSLTFTFIEQEAGLLPAQSFEFTGVWLPATVAFLLVGPAAKVSPYAEIGVFGRGFFSNNLYADETVFGFGAQIGLGAYYQRWGLHLVYAPRTSIFPRLLSIQASFQLN